MNRSIAALALIACAACTPKPTPSARADATFAVGATCVAAWPHDEPLLVCGGDRVRIEPMR